MVISFTCLLAALALQAPARDDASSHSVTRSVDAPVVEAVAQVLADGEYRFSRRPAHTYTPRQHINQPSATDLQRISAFFTFYFMTIMDSYYTNQYYHLAL